VNPLLHWLTSPEWTQVVGTLLHSLWQGALIAIALAVLMRRLTNPVTRYRCALGMLCLLAIASIITWATLNVPKPPAPIAPQISLSESEVPTTPTGALNLGSADKVVIVGKMSPPATQTNWTAWLALVWMVGAAAMLLRASIKVAGAENLRRSCKPLNDERMITLVAEACRTVELARKIRVAVTDKLTSPAVVGIIVPTLILPLSLFSALTPEQIRFVLLHELAHIRRGDYLANLFQLFAEALLFFNPAVWWISHQIRREREACCDALAIQLSGAPADYARTLVRVAENILQPTTTAALAFGDDGCEPSPLADRVQRLLVPGYRPALRLTWRAMLAAMCISGTLLFLSAMGARNVVGAVSSNVTDTASKPAKNVLEKINGTADSKNDSFTQPKWEGSWNPRFEIQKVSGGTVMPWFTRDGEISAVLEQIKFERVFFRNRKLSEVLGELKKALLATDPKKIGVSLLMPPDWAYPPKRDGIDSVIINMPSELRDTTMRSVLDSIVSSASRPIQYCFGGTGALFEMKFEAPTNMWFKRFKVDRKTFLPFIGVADSMAEFDLNKDDTNNASDKIGDAIKKRFLQAGVDLRPPNHVLYKIGPDLLYIYAPKKDIEVIEELLNGITPKAPGNSSSPTTTNRPSKDSIQKLTLPGHTISSAAQVSAALPRDIDSMLSPTPDMDLWFVDGQAPLSSQQFSYRSGPIDDRQETKKSKYTYASSTILTVVKTNNYPPMEITPQDSSSGGFLADPKKGTVVFTNGVEVKLNNQKLTADFAQINQQTGEVLARGNARLETTNGTYSGKELIWNTKSNLITGVNYTITQTTQPTNSLAQIEKLFVREFNVSATLLFERILTTVTKPELDRLPSSNRTIVVNENFRNWFANIGVNLDPQSGKSVFYNEHKGILYVRATMVELDTIETSFQTLAVANSQPLTTRTFHVEPGAIRQAIESLFPQFNPVTSTNFTASIRALLESSGAKLSPPKSVYYNDRAGGLFVRATREDLDAIESLLNVIGQQPAQVNIKALFVELPFGKGQPTELAEILEPVTRVNKTNFTGILTASQFKTILRVLETSADVKILARPQVTTLSGRQAQIQVADVKTIISGMTAVVTNGATNLLYQSQAMPFGPVLDVLPTVSKDGYTVLMTLTPTFTEFLGYEDAKQLKLSAPEDKAILPLPVFRTRQITTSAAVWDGQTIVLGNFSDQILADPWESKTATKTSNKKSSKQILVFVTPTIIDSVGNPANKDLGIPSRLIPGNP
jgi:beta-lactamase regulating signal transducer with metallopeptidase domain